jgi:membrane carboxypeptidase/penicillin-binding protein
MKHIFLLAITLTITHLATAQSKKSEDIAKFNSETVDMGKLKLNNPVTATFTVTNIGKEDLVIENVTPGCGCTKSDYTKEPIKPGKTGTITATYNAAAVGKFSKTVSVKFLGVDQQKNLVIVGTVE